jgi:hypothetical protein
MVYHMNEFVIMNSMRVFEAEEKHNSWCHLMELGSTRYKPRGRVCNPCKGGESIPGHTPE